MEEIKDSVRTLEQIKQDYLNSCGTAGELAFLIKAKTVELDALYRKMSAFQNEWSQAQEKEKARVEEEAKKKEGSISESAVDAILQASPVAEVM